MDYFFRTLALVPRWCPTAVRVKSIGFLKGKRTVVDRTASERVFSFILRGEGFYEIGDKRIEIAAPCVITQYPGPFFRYGPEGKSPTWDELYIVFESESFEELKRRNLWKEERSFWAIKEGGWVSRLSREIIAAMGRSEEPSTGDLLDRLSELILERSLVGAKIHQPDNQSLSAIERIHAHASERLDATPDWDHLAMKEGLAPSTMRRRWMCRYRCPPARYHNRMRMQEAARLLVTTRARVSEIAERLGYDDPLYFSRRFRRHFGSSPRMYRTANHLS